MMGPNGLYHRFQQKNRSRTNTIILLIIRFRIMPIRRGRDQTIPTSSVCHLICPVLRNVFRVHRLRQYKKVFHSKNVSHYHCPMTNITIRNLTIASEGLMMIVKARLQINVLLMDRKGIRRRTRFLLRKASVIPDVNVRMDHCNGFIHHPLGVTTKNLNNVPRLYHAIHAHRCQYNVKRVTRMMACTFKVGDRILTFISNRRSFYHYPTRHSHRPHIVPLQTIMRSSQDDGHQFVIPFKVNCTIRRRYSQSAFGIFPYRIGILILLHRHLRNIRIHRIFGVLFQINTINSRVRPVPLVFHGEQPFCKRYGPSHFVN